MPASEDPGGNSPPDIHVVEGDFVEVAVGWAYWCAIDALAGIHCGSWDPPEGGEAPESVVGSVPSGAFHSIVVGDEHACALTADDNAIVCWGEGGADKTQPPDADTPVQRPYIPALPACGDAPPTVSATTVDLGRCTELPLGLDEAFAYHDNHHRMLELGWEHHGRTCVWHDGGWKLLARVPSLDGKPSHAVDKVYVSASASGANDGTSWESAYPALADALDYASANPPGTCANIEEAWLAAGMYRPDRGAGRIAGDVSLAFELPAELVVRGGFDGSEGAPEERSDPTAVTVLSGDLAGDDGSSDGVTWYDANISGENSERVLSAGSGCALIEGVTITAADSTEGAGGGAWARGDCTFRDVTFAGNRAQYGGGLAVRGATGTTLTIEGSRFVGNRARGQIWVDTSRGYGGTNNGGALAVAAGDLVVRDTVFEKNRNFGNNGARGGAVNLEGVVESRFERVTFADNECAQGSAMYLWRGVHYFEDVVFEENGGGEAVLTTASNNVTLSFARTRFEGNAGGAIYFGSANWYDTLGLWLSSVELIDNGQRAIDVSLGNNDNDIDVFTLRGQNLLFAGQPQALKLFGYPGSHADVLLDHATVVGYGEGGLAAVHTLSLPLRLQSSILWSDAPDTPLALDGNASVDVVTSTVAGGEAALSSNLNVTFGGATSFADGGNLTADPLLQASSAGDYRLGVLSPAIDSGALLTPDFLDLNENGDTSEALPVDLAGGARTQGDASDQGAYERDPSEL